MSITDDLPMGGVRIQIQQNGTAVTITLTCADDYAAMILTDKLSHAVLAGGFALETTVIEKGTIN